jgi:hypothetical protein|tara:strand:- start:127 stop:873 length:747 start_codon:yes stop_codon:yes gene_type:complete
MRVLSGSLIVKLLILLLLISLLIFGFKPFKDSLDAEITLIEEVESYQSETRRLSDGSYLVAVRTPMPSVTAEMVRWWFAEFLETTEHYKWWHPSDHIWMDWENKIPGEIIGASHLVHEYIGGELSKLRIQFVNPSEFFGYNPNDENTFVICARAGMLDIEINIAKMCHIVKNNENGSEMRSRFWLGHVASREGNQTIPSITGFMGNMAISRLLAVSKEDAEDLKRHAKEEMSFLAKLLPPLYHSENIN